MTSSKVDVTKDRDKYIGGSDIPAIMGLSEFMTRYELLREKALGEVSTFEGNEYTQYGKDMEPVIRDYFNTAYHRHFVDDTCRIDGDLRYHADGFEEDNEVWEHEDTVLEIKTTSHVAPYSGFGSFEEERQFLREHYKAYLVQLLLGMRMYGARFGLLAIYERPADFSKEFDEMRLDFFTIRAPEWEDVYAEIDDALDKFRADVKKLKDNPDLDEAGLVSKDLMALANDAVTAVNELAEYEQQIKAAEKKAKAAKEALYQAMNSNNIDSWTLKGGTKVTRVKAKPDTTVKVIDEDRFRVEHPIMAEQYSIEKTKRGRKGYVLITPPKNE